VNREDYRELVWMVNQKDCMDLLIKYAAARIEAARSNLETATDMDTVNKLQGRIAELKRFSTLRDEVLKGAE